MEHSVTRPRVHASASTSAKLDHLEGLRGLGPCVVVVAHFLAAYQPHAIFGRPYPQSAWWEDYMVTTPLGLLIASGTAVSLFFILSGYVLSLPFCGDSERGQEDLCAALLKRPLRLAPVVMLGMLLSHFVKDWGLTYRSEVSSVTGSHPWLLLEPGTRTDIFADVLRPFSTAGAYNSPLWTIGIEMYGSILVFCLLALTRGLRGRWAVYALLLGWYLDSWMQCFIAGLAIADLHRSRPALFEGRGARLAALLLAAGVVVGAFPDRALESIRSGTFYSMLPTFKGILAGGMSTCGALLLFVGVLLSPSAQRVLSLPPCRFLGQVSFSLYAIHFPLMLSLSAAVFLPLVEPLGRASATAIAAAIYFAATLALAWVVTRVVDRPVVSLSNRIALYARAAWSKNSGEVSRDHGWMLELSRLRAPASGLRIPSPL